MEFTQKGGNFKRRYSRILHKVLFMSSAEFYAVDAQAETPQGQAENHDRDL